MSNHLSQDIEGVVTFLTAADGGRSTPAQSGYRPQFHYDGYDWDARQIYPDVEKVEPGMTVRVLFSFTRPQQHDGKLHVGKPFLIREGRRIVGYGAVTKILELANSARSKPPGELLNRAAPGACERNLSPQRGGTCSNCGRTVCPFEGVTADVEDQLKTQIRSGNTVAAIKLLRAVSGRDLVDAKWMIEHMYGTAGIPFRGLLDAISEDP